MSRQITKVSRRLISNVLRLNGIDPKALKGSNKLFGGAGVGSGEIKIRRKDVAKIKRRLGEGQLVVLRPCTSGSAGRAWEFVNPEYVRLESKSIRHKQVQDAHANGAAVPAKNGHEPLRQFDPRAIKLGKVIDRMVVKSGIGVKKMAEGMGIQSSILYHWKSGTYLPRHESMVKLAKYVDDTPQLAEFKDDLIAAVKK